MRRILFVTLLAVLPITSHSQIQTPEEQHIPGRYEYTHSWTYAAPDAYGFIHCDETGTLDFYPDGTFADTALQHHTLSTKYREMEGWQAKTEEMETYLFDFMYYCQGQWRVEDGKFIFSEHAEGFDMVLQNESPDQWTAYYADQIEENSLPESSRWFTFNIERLDKEWFIWSFTYPTGRKDLWEMKRVHP